MGTLVVIAVALVVIFATSSEQFQGKFFKSKNIIKLPKVYARSRRLFKKTVHAGG